MVINDLLYNLRAFSPYNIHLYSSQKDIILNLYKEASAKDPVAVADYLIPPDNASPEYFSPDLLSLIASNLKKHKAELGDKPDLVERVMDASNKVSSYYTHPMSNKRGGSVPRALTEDIAVLFETLPQDRRQLYFMERYKSGKISAPLAQAFYASLDSGFMTKILIPKLLDDIRGQQSKLKKLKKSWWRRTKGIAKLEYHIALLAANPLFNLELYEPPKGIVDSVSAQLSPEHCKETYYPDSCVVNIQGKSMPVLMLSYMINQEGRAIALMYDILTTVDRNQSIFSFPSTSKQTTYDFLVAAQGELDNLKRMKMTPLGREISDSRVDKLSRVIDEMREYYVQQYIGKENDK